MATKPENVRLMAAFEFFVDQTTKQKSIEAALNVTATEFEVSLRQVKRWYKIYNWRLRSEQRAIEISRLIEEKTNQVIVDCIVEQKAKYRRLITDMIDRMPNLAPNNIKDYETLVKLDMTLMGESDGSTAPVKIVVRLEDD
jgi:hypothetical protein